ncbi:MAG: sugar phosphate isomerase/epimerase [Actinomycetota bacterium]|jgi:sugar phosphate isomerase/epimerase|nr:sugar phosphate isomerase/epimerase [Actinomycetota bacterium]
MKPRPKIAAFPKGYFNELVARSGLTIEDWMVSATTLEIDGVELYPRFLAGTGSSYLAGLRRRAEDAGLKLPMMCSSPDFVDPRPGGWESAVESMREMVDVMVELSPGAGWRSVRVLSGQRWPGVPEDEAVGRAVEGIERVVSYASPRGVHVVMENHYKDGLWEYPEFAQSSRLFLTITDKIGSPWFGVNFDPSNAIVAGEDPLALLGQVLGRVRSMGASDRSLRPGYTLEDLRAHRGAGYPEALQHGVVGEGLNDYPAILSALASVGFDGWISIEDGERGGQEGLQDIRDSARYLRSLVDRYWSRGDEQSGANTRSARGAPERDRTGARKEDSR